MSEVCMLANSALTLLLCSAGVGVAIGIALTYGVMLWKYSSAIETERHLSKGLRRDT